MHAALKLQCGRVTGNKKFTIGDLIHNTINTQQYNANASHTKLVSYGSLVLNQRY